MTAQSRRLKPTRKDRVRKAIAHSARTPDSRLSDGLSLTSDLGMSALDLIDLAMTVEDILRIEIDDAALKLLETVGDVLALAGDAG